MSQPAGKRTCVSTLTDAELVLFDCLFDVYAGYRQLMHEGFSGFWNRPSHGLDDLTLIQTLERFEALGLLSSEPYYDVSGEPDRLVHLTAVGGALWESERQPNWNRYLIDTHSAHRVSIYGHSADICSDFFEAACKAGLINYTGGRILRAVAPRKLIYWRPLQPVHVVCAPIAEVDKQQYPWPSWTCLDAHRSWWRVPNEIADLWPTDG